MTRFAPGEVVAQRFTVIQKLATGGMAEVYLATQHGPAGFSKQVVLKVIHPNLAADSSFVNMFHNEAQLSALLTHPGIVQVHDFGVDGDVHYIAMEYVDGVDLHDLLGALGRRGRRMPRALALQVAAEACHALHYAHTLTGPKGQPLQIVHRDVSPENILIGYSGQVKLADFGIAKARTLQSFTRTGMLKGKFEYMPPDVIEGLPPDHRMDVYAMGVVLYLVFLGRTPFREASDERLIARIRYDEPPRPRDLDPKLPATLEQLLLKALQKAPGERFSTMEEMAVALEKELMRTGRPSTAEELGQFVTKMLPPDRTRPFQGTARRGKAAFPTPPREEVLEIVPTQRDAVPRFLEGRTAELDDLPTTRFGGESVKAALGMVDEALIEKTTDEMPHPPKHISSQDPTDKVEPADMPTSPLPGRDDEDY